ncbi:MAG: hypothetical protein ACKOF9_04360 [Burkholderiales bacterium]
MKIDEVDAVQTQAAPDATEQQPAEVDSPDSTQQDDQQPEPEQDTQAAGEDAKSKLESMLDDLTDDPNSPTDKAEVKPADHVADASKKVEAKTAEPEEAELLEGVKSERGKERIKQVFAEKKQLEQDINDFRQLVHSTGMSPQEFARTLEFGRLMNSGDEKNLRVALEMIEGQRAALYQKLGVEAPGVDLLKGHDDLKQAVDNMEITRERAVELAKYRKQEAALAQRQQADQQTAQQREQFDQQVKQAAGSMEAYLQTRANEVDHAARMKVITAHFKNPANLQQFVSTYQPHQWADTVRLMYDGIVVPKANAQGPQPIRSRPTNLGTPAASGAAPIDRVAQRLESMGL